jgi:putative oligomerization/nucleic acid binding protein
MVVIFGFGPGKGDDQGEVAPTVCPNCHNQVFLHHVRSKKTVRLYFVPVMPYGTDDYLVCPVCSRGLQVSGPQVPEVRAMAQATASMRAGRLTEAAYGTRVEQFWRRLGGNPARQPPPGAAGPAGPGPAPPASPAPAAPPAPAGGDVPGWLSQLRELAQLHDQGVLSDEQYEAAKRRAIQQE